jgi:hypothetical protein
MPKNTITAAKREAMSRNGIASNIRRHANGFYSSEAQSRRRMAQISAEQKMAKALERDGFQVFSPTVVCDRIATKDGKIYFVEFKKAGQDLRPGQQFVHDLSPENYIIRYS